MHRLITPRPWSAPKLEDKIRALIAEGYSPESIQRVLEWVAAGNDGPCPPPTTTTGNPQTSYRLTPADM